MIKLIATDIDGTLIRESTPDLYPEIADAVERLVGQGMKFCVASGRQYASIRNVFKDVKAGLIYIAENGAQLRLQDKDILLQAMKKSVAGELIRQLRTYNDEIEIVVSTPELSLVETANQEFLDLLNYGYHNRYRVVKDVLAEPEEILKVAVYRKGSAVRLGQDILVPAWKDRLKVCIAGKEWVDFMDASVDKGNALAYLQQFFGISEEETMAFGDNNNDIGMLSRAGESYAVENAGEDVKRAARHICPSYHDKGVYTVISKLLAS